jgi:uncharacterized membrane protein
LTILHAGSRETSGGERRRWYVHLVLLVSLAGSLISLIYLSHSITIHVIFGVVFMVTMLFHLFQRRRTIATLLERLMTVQSRTSRTTRLAISDIIFELLALNVLVSGTVDIVRHQETQLTLAGLPPGLDQWHKLAAILFVVYAVFHIIRRRKRLRRSHIR